MHFIARIGQAVQTQNRKSPEKYTQRTKHFGEEKVVLLQKKALREHSTKVSISFLETEQDIKGDCFVHAGSHAIASDYYQKIRRLLPNLNHTCLEYPTKYRYCHRLIPMFPRANCNGYRAHIHFRHA